MQPITVEKMIHGQVNNSYIIVHDVSIHHKEQAIPHQESNVITGANQYVKV